MLGVAMRDKLNGLVNKYRALRGQRDAGRISDEEYKRQLEGSAVADDRQEGCWWNVSPESGLWIFFDGREWVQQAPAGFDPMVSTGPYQPMGAAPAGGKSLTWLWILLTVVVVVAIGTAMTLVIVLNSGGGGAANAEKRIESAIEDFYKAADDADYKDLSPLITADVADDVEEAEKDDELEDLLRPYKGLDVDEIEDIEIDGNDATATVVLDSDGQRIQQEIELELVGGSWKIADLGRIETAAQRGDAGEERRELRSGDAETDVRNFLDSFMQAFKRYDIDAMKSMVVTSAHAEMDFDEMEQARSDPEQHQAVLEYMQQLAWEISDLQVDPSGNRAEATVKINLAPDPQRIEMEKRGGLWLIVGIKEIE